MTQTLYRKYRPQTFSDVVGQNHIKITLQNEILSGQLAHAYLFTGPHGIGKTSLARILAKALNCQGRKEREFEPCNQCQSCQEIMAGKSLDLIEIDAATHTQVDKVRENIVANVNFPPHCKYKIFIIDEVHMLSLSAFNALLKTLEEPPEFVVFILCTTEAYKLPETVISRCQRFDFKKVSAEQIISKLKKIIKLEQIKINDEVLSTIARRSGGFIRDAETLLSQVISLFGPGEKVAVHQGKQKEEITWQDVAAILPRSDFYLISDLADSLINNNARAGVTTINKLINDGGDLERFNLDLIDYWRQMILIKLGLKNTDETIGALPEEIENKLIKQAEQVEMSKLIRILEKFMVIQPALKEAEITQLPLEMAVVELCEEGNIKTLKHPSAEFIPSGAEGLRAGENIKAKDKEIIKPVRQAQDRQLNNESNITPAFPARPERSDFTGRSDNSQIINDTSIDLKTVKESWLEIIKASQKINHSLALILKTACPLSVTHNQLELGFEFEIHVKKIKEEKYQQAIEQILATILGKKLKIKPVILSPEKVKELKPERENEVKNSSDNQLHDILTSFGGKVIE